MMHLNSRRTYGSGHLHGMSAPGLDLEIALEPDALHRETQRRLSTGSNAHNQPLVLERGHTNLGQLDHLTLRSPDTTSQQAYQYDALGRLSFRSLQGDPAEKVIAYSYDAAGRLIGSQHGDNAHRYSVDAAGNRLAAPSTENPTPNTTNQLAQLNGTRYRYDGAGNLIERQQPNGERLTLGYDGANRLVHLIHASELGYTREATYRYDGLGRRISKTVRHTNGTTATTHYGWDGDRIVREETENQRTTVVYEPGSFVPMLRIDDTQQGQILSAYITDALGTPMQLVTPNGQPRWLAEPDDWAAVKNQRAVRNVTQPIRFQGQWHDEESELYYNRHRYYDPQQGRYISQDPIGLNGGTNLYGYVTNPTGMVDPLGLFQSDMGSISAAYGSQALAHAAPAPLPDQGGQVLTGGDYNPGIIASIFPTRMSALAKDANHGRALRYQGATRSDITLPAASGALGAPMVGAAAPGAAKIAAGASSALAASANQLSLRAMCSVATVSPGAAVGIANPAVQEVALDILDSSLPGPPSPNRSGIVGYIMGTVFSPEEWGK
ncbi:RHS repeat-associated core domain-containing protein [Halomonas sp. M1]|uniref:RHS repeat-associated core domain-containing protein n=1 Tax=Halomonas sp. M1 TaxID=3035470 RepID=UPI00248687B2|nr:RHS repeat-associated core domain-containing protein [Halomonas sp. M1]WFE72158.1 RHS repeat-associated core domain-containing protein [Halomonas sp. M1]